MYTMKREHVVLLFAVLQAVVTLLGAVATFAPVYTVKTDGRYARVGLLLGETDGFVSHGLRAMLSADNIRNTDTLNVLLVLVCVTGVTGRSLAISAWRAARRGDRLTYLLHTILVATVVTNTSAFVAFCGSLHACFKDVKGTDVTAELGPGFYFLVLATVGAWVELLPAYWLTQYRSQSAPTITSVSASSTL